MSAIEEFRQQVEACTEAIAVARKTSRKDKPMTDLTKWDAIVNDPERPVAEYVEHERALQEYEGEKLTRLKIMTRAQEIRTWFLKLPMADRKIFLDVLTADEDGAMTHMFSLQATWSRKAWTTTTSRQ